MSFAGDVIGALQIGRGLADSLMVDTCVVTREDPGGEPGDVTGERPRVEVFAGRAKSQTYQAWEQNPEAGEFRYTVQRYYVHFSTRDSESQGYEPLEGDVVEWTACPYSPTRVGVRERVTAPFSKSLATAIRVPTDRISHDG